MNLLFHGMSTECEKCSAQVLRAQFVVFRLLLLSKQQPKTQRLVTYDDKSNRKAANPHI